MSGAGTVAVSCDSANEGCDQRRTIPIDHRSRDESGSVHREREARATGRDGIGQQRLVNQGNWILCQRGRDGE